MRHKEGERGKRAAKIIERVLHIDKCLISNIFMSTYQTVSHLSGKSAATCFGLENNEEL